jgi:hypothetical protein
MLPVPGLGLAPCLLQVAGQSTGQDPRAALHDSSFFTPIISGMQEGFWGVTLLFLCHRRPPRVLFALLGFSFYAFLSAWGIHPFHFGLVILQWESTRGSQGHEVVRSSSSLSRVLPLFALHQSGFCGLFSQMPEGSPELRGRSAISSHFY